MHTYVVLLRGVNVGKAKRVPMAAFSTLLHEVGCADVVTLLNSGNAVVCARKASGDELAARVFEALHATFGFEVPVVVKSIADFRTIVKDNELISAAMDHSRFLVVFAQTGAAMRTLKSLPDVVRPPDQFLLGRKAAYLYCANGLLQSEAARALLGKLGNVVTTRNWATVLKLLALGERTAFETR